MCVGGLKEGNTTSRWVQIVTALKMALVVMTAPIWLPWAGIVYLATGAMKGPRLLWAGFLRVMRFLRSGVHWFNETIRAYWRVYNKRSKCVVIAGFWISLVLGGLFAMYLWVAATVLFVVCTVPTDARFYIKLSRQMQDAWNEAMDDDSFPKPDGLQVSVSKKGRKGFACRLACRAIGRVGLLSCTRANALVYQKVILDEMAAMNVRFSDRVQILPYAVMACLERPDAVAKVEDAVHHLVNPMGYM